MAEGWGHRSENRDVSGIICMAGVLGGGLGAPWGGSMTQQTHATKTFICIQ